MTLGNSLEDVDLLRSSARVRSPGEGEDNSGLGKGSAICNSFDLHGFRVYFLSRYRFDLLLNTAKAKYFNPKS